MKSPAPSRPQKMALIPACIFLCFAALSVQAEETSVTPQPPDILLGPLFNDVPVSYTHLLGCNREYPSSLCVKYRQHPVGYVRV